MQPSAHPRRIVLSTFGSLGDVNPYVGVACELKARGHYPVIATTAAYREKIEALGVGFHPVWPDLPSYDRPEAVRGMVEQAINPKTGGDYILRTLILPHLRDIYADLLSAVRGADLLVTHPLPLVGPIVAAKTRISWISTVLAPFSLCSAYDPGVLPALPRLHTLLALSPALARGFLRLVKWVLARKLQPIAQLRHEGGLPPGDHPLVEGQHSPAGVLGLFSPVLAAPQPDWPPHTCLTRFPLNGDVQATRRAACPPSWPGSSRTIRPPWYSPWVLRRYGSLKNSTPRVSALPRPYSNAPCCSLAARLHP
ncbi:MAG: glycosyltransferase [bacterium]